MDSLNKNFATDKQILLLKSINSIYESAYSCESSECLAKNILSMLESLTESKSSFVGTISEGRSSYHFAFGDLCFVEHNAGIHPPSPESHNDEILGLCETVLKSGKSIFLNSQSDPQLAPYHKKLNWGLFAGVPLIKEGRTEGLVAVTGREGGYSQEHVEILEVGTFNYTDHIQKTG